MKKRILAAICLSVILAALPSFADDNDIYDSLPSISPYYAGSVKREVLEKALSELNYVRRLIGVSDNVVLDDESTEAAQHAAVLLNAIGHLDHTPAKPDDMPEDFYNLAYKGTSSSNIAGGSTLQGSISMYMNDSDSSNIDRLGHRRWLMNPNMTTVGFGIMGYFSATYVFQKNGWREWPVDYGFITWPASRNNHPLSYFAPSIAWSVILDPGRFSSLRGTKSNDVRVSLTRLSDGHEWNFSSSSSNGYFNVDTGGYGRGECIIFRPSNLEKYNDGEKWHAEISGLEYSDGSSVGILSFDVTFDDILTGFESDYSLRMWKERHLLTIDTETLPDASADIPYSARIQFTGRQPVTWEAENLPSGLSFNPVNTTLSGTLTDAGAFTFTLKASNDVSRDSRTYTLNVVRVKPSITTENLVSPIEVNGNHLLDTQLSATGSKPIAWSLFDGNLPDGITLSADGKLSGKALSAGMFTFTVKAENDAGYDTRAFTIVAEAVKPSMSNFSLRDATERLSYRQYLYADGTEPMTWSVVSGNLPKGLIVSYDNEAETGIISGIPEEAGRFTFTISASNSAGSDTRVLTLTVRANPNTPSIPDNPSTPDTQNTPDSPNTPGNNANDPQADKVRSLMGMGGNVPFTRLSGIRTLYNQWEYDDEVAAVLEDVEIPSTGIYLIQNIALRFRIPAGSYLTWHNSARNYGAFSEAANPDCVFLDDYGNEIAMPTASELYHVSAAVYLEGGRTYSPFITAEYPYEYRYDDQYHEPYHENGEPQRENSGDSGGGCNSLTILAVILAAPFIRKVRNP